MTESLTEVRFNCSEEDRCVRAPKHIVHITSVRMPLEWLQYLTTVSKLRVRGLCWTIEGESTFVQGSVAIITTLQKAGTTTVVALTLAYAASGSLASVCDPSRGVTRPSRSHIGPE